MVDHDESDKIMKISEKVDKSDTYKGFSSDISLLIQEFHQTKHKKKQLKNVYSNEILE